jgi:hypothetical protein
VRRIGGDGKQQGNETRKRKETNMAKVKLNPILEQVRR